MAADCYDPIFVSPKEEPVWVSGRRPPETDVSYFDVAKGEGRKYEEAYDAAVKKIVQKRSLATGRQVQVDSGGISPRMDKLEVLAKIEREYHRQCRADEHSVYLLAQIGKFPNVELPPFPEDYLERKKDVRESSDKKTGESARKRAKK